jgi:WD40 repeat protein
VIAAGSLDGKGRIWQIANGQAGAEIEFTADPALTIESLRELRFSEAGALLAGWGRTGLQIWDGHNGERLWSSSLLQRAVSAHYSLDTTLQVTPEGKRLANLALPFLQEDAPSAWGVRGSDIISQEIRRIQRPEEKLASNGGETQSCIEEGMEKRSFWAIRMRALARDARILVTLSCAQVPGEEQQAIIVRRWDLAAKGRKRGKAHPQIVSSILVGRCEDGAAPYAITPDVSLIAFVHGGQKIRICDTRSGIYSELASGTMGGSAKLAISPDAQWLAVAREDSEINEGVIDLWSISTGQVEQKLYHPWQISALHFAERELLVALTDGTIQIFTVSSNGAKE